MSSSKPRLLLEGHAPAACPAHPGVCSPPWLLLSGLDAALWFECCSPYFPLPTLFRHLLGTISNDGNKWLLKEQQNKISGTKHTDGGSEPRCWLQNVPSVTQLRVCYLPPVVEQSGVQKCWSSSTRSELAPALSLAKASSCSGHLPCRGELGALGCCGHRDRGQWLLARLGRTQIPAAQAGAWHYTLMGSSYPQ